MQTTHALPSQMNPTWQAVYQAAAHSPILRALRLAASDLDALARQVADRCTAKSFNEKSLSGGRRRRRRLD